MTDVAETAPDTGCHSKPSPPDSQSQLDFPGIQLDDEAIGRAVKRDHIYGGKADSNRVIPYDIPSR